MPMTRVVNLLREDYDVRICRPGQWGNPFHIGRGVTRAYAIEKYREWILTQPKLLAQLHILKGKRLGCVCAPLACHGDVLVELVEGFFPLYHKLKAELPGLKEEHYHREIQHRLGYDCPHPFPLLRFGSSDGPYVKDAIAAQDHPVFHDRVRREWMADPGIRDCLWCPVCYCHPYKEKRND